MSRGVIAAAVVVATLAAFVQAAGARGTAPKPRPPRGREEPVGSQIRDVATTLSVPIDEETSAVIGLPERFWQECPRFLPSPTTLDGRGAVGQYMNARGGTVSKLYFGVVPLLAPEPGDKADARVARTVEDFGLMMREKYKRIDWEIIAGKTTFSPVPMTLDGKRTPAWRTERYRSRPAMAYGGPDSVFEGACLLFLTPGGGHLVYVALDAKGGGTTLDKVTERLSVKPTREANPTGRRVQLNDLAVSIANPSRFPVRQIAFDVPAGVVLTPTILALKGEWVWAEERVDAQGKAVAILRIRQMPSDEARTVADDHEVERALWTDEDPSPSKEVDIAVRGQKAWVFSHRSLRDGATARAHTAVLRIDDQTVYVTWTSLNGAAQAEQDRPAFLALVQSIDFTVRW